MLGLKSFLSALAIACALALPTCTVAYLPPYSPDLNPIEQAFSTLSAHLSRIGARTFSGPFNAIGEVCDPFSPQECWSFFQTAGYASA